MFRGIKKLLYRTKRVFRNLRDWLPVIVKDEHWDEGYLYIILHRKLELMEKFFKSDNAYSANAENVAEEIKTVKEALERLIKNEYISPEELSKDIDKAFYLENEFIREDKDIVFDGIKKNIEDWWD